MISTDLNDTEIYVFSAIRQAIKNETGNQFGWSDEIARYAPSMGSRELAGYCSQLRQKGLYATQKIGAYTMISLTKEGKELAREFGDFTDYEID